MAGNPGHLLKRKIMKPKHKKPMTFKEVFSCLCQANDYLGDCDGELEVWIGEQMYKIVRVGQFSIIPTVTLTLTERPLMDLSK